MFIQVFLVLLQLLNADVSSVAFEGHPNDSVLSCNKCTVNLDRSPLVTSELEFKYTLYGGREQM